jgi:hypothetical protein
VRYASTRRALLAQSALSVFAASVPMFGQTAQPAAAQPLSRGSLPRRLRLSARRYRVAPPYEGYDQHDRSEAWVYSALD